MSDLAAAPGEDLDDGTRSDTPDGDNLVLDFARAEAEANATLVAANGGVVVHDEAWGLHLCDLGVASPFGNLAMVERPIADADGPAVARRIRSFFAEREGGPYLVFSPWRTTDWSAEGLRAVGHPPVMVRPPGPATADGAVDGLEVVTVTAEDDLAEFERTVIEAYPLAELQPWQRWSYLSPSLLDTPWSFHLARLDGVPVATAAAFAGPAVSAIELVSTRPEVRGRGIGAAVTLAAATARPDRPALLVASDDGQGLYRRLGFLSLQRYTLWLGMR